MDGVKRYFGEGEEMHSRCMGLGLSSGGRNGDREEDNCDRCEEGKCRKIDVEIGVWASKLLTHRCKR